MIVYGDLLFLINFSMDFLCFYISFLLIHRKMPTLRTALASVIGGVYSVAALFVKVGQGWAFVIDVLLLVLMCLAVYASRGMRVLGFAKFVLLYFFVSALLGGIMTALFSLFNQVDIFSGISESENDISVWIFALLTVVSTVFTVKGGGFFKSSVKKTSATLVLLGDKGRVGLSTLLDSGN